MHYLRLKGLIVFFAIIAAIGVFFYVFAESLIKSGLEKAISLSTKAEVNIDRVELDYSPFSLAIFDLQATDPAAPKTNLVSFREASASVDVWQYLLGKTIIESLTVDGLAFSSARMSEGEVYETSQASESAAESSEEGMSSFEASLPNPKELLNDSNLITVKASKALEQSYKAEKVKLKNIDDNLPDKKRLAYYENEVKALTKTKVKSLEDIEKIKAKYDELKVQFKADKQAVAAAKAQLASSKDVLAQHLSAVKEAPAKDWQNIESTYQLDKIDGADFAHMLFGEQAREYYNTAMVVYEKTKPMLSETADQQAEEEKVKAVGRFVYFKEDNPLPLFLIKQAKFSMTFPQGDFVVNLSELTHQHWVRGLPTQYEVISNNVGGSGKASLNGEFTLTEEQVANTTGNWSLTGYPVNNVPLRDSGDISLSITQSLFAGSGNYKINGSDLASLHQLVLSDTQYQGSSDTELGNMLINTLSSIEQVSVDLGINGDIQNPNWDISSPLDKQLKNAFNNQLSAKVTSFKNDVKAGLNQKLNSALKFDQTQGQSLVDIESLLNSSDNALDSLLNSDVIKQKQKEFENRLKDKAKDKLKEKFGSFFNKDGE